MNIPKWNFIEARGSGERIMEWPKLPTLFYAQDTEESNKDQTETWSEGKLMQGRGKKKETGSDENNMTDTEFIFSWRYFQK